MIRRIAAVVVLGLIAAGTVEARQNAEFCSAFGEMKDFSSSLDVASAAHQAKLLSCKSDESTRKLYKSVAGSASGTYYFVFEAGASGNYSEQQFEQSLAHACTQDDQAWASYADNQYVKKFMAAGVVEAMRGCLSDAFFTFNAWVNPTEDFEHFDIELKASGSGAHMVITDVDGSGPFKCDRWEDAKRAHPDAPELKSPAASEMTLFCSKPANEPARIQVVSNRGSMPPTTLPVKPSVKTKALQYTLFIGQSSVNDSINSWHYFLNVRRNASDMSRT